MLAAVLRSPAQPSILPAPGVYGGQLSGGCTGVRLPY